jgi:hypothetical protein
MPAVMVELKDCNRHGGGPLKLHRGATFGEVSIERRQPPKPQKAGITEIGTGLAINNLSLGGAAQLPKRSGRGGARNYANRESHALKGPQIANLSAAEAHSRKIGLPFTRMITIHWKAAGVPLERIAAATGSFIDSLTRWLLRRGHRTAWLWVHENASDKGWHCHFLAHVPADLVKPLVGAQKRWLRRITGRAYRAKIIRSDPIGRRLRLETGNPELHFQNARAALAYLCKGAPQRVLDAAGIQRQHKPQGLVIGRRCSASQNINRAARDAYDG